MNSSNNKQGNIILKLHMLKNKIKKQKIRTIRINLDKKVKNKIQKNPNKITKINGGFKNCSINLKQKME